MIRDLLLCAGNSNVPPESEVSLLLTPRVGDVSILDKSGHAVPLTLSNTVLDSTITHFGNPTMALSGGPGGGISIGAGNLYIGANPFTLEFNVYLPIFTEVAVTLFDNRFSAVAIPLGINLHSTGVIDFYTGVSNFSPALIIKTGEMQHIAITSDANKDVRCFVDGTQVITTFKAPSTFDVSPGAYRFGRNAAAGSNVFKGTIAEVRLTIGTALYTANFTPPTEPFPIP